MSRDALVVGINTYQFEAWNLKTPGENAEAIAQILERYGGFRVKRLPEVKDKAEWHLVKRDRQLSSLPFRAIALLPCAPI